ncbi:hypothetical protein HNQ71_007070 [Mesorhizobium sangaii]|uniref:Transposase IS66 zinc-finger binding domain-containing protein n=1 Tax=Mesorhizobium sangaii TaxID=505389 RepID=A0A841PUY9_9HYPH|nr:hypothetical protein [Mesorhizobium sangaii]
MLKVLERACFGRRSERLHAGSLSEEQYALVFDENETGHQGAGRQGGGAVEDQACAATAQRLCAPSRTGRGDHRSGGSGRLRGAQRVMIGEDVSERLDVTPAKFRVIITRRPKYAYKGWDGVVQAAAPARIIESGIHSCAGQRVA